MTDDTPATPVLFATRREAEDAARHIYDSPPATGAWRDGSLRMLEAACAKVEAHLGAYAHQVLVELAGGEPSVCAVIAKLIETVPEPGAWESVLGPPGVAQEGGGWVSGSSRGGPS